MGYLQDVHGVTLREKVRSSEIRTLLYVEPLLRIKRSQLRWLGHVTRMSQERLARQVMLAKPAGKRPRGSDITSPKVWGGVILILGEQQYVV